IMMPGMNGFDVLRALREKQATATIPTIMVTAKAREASDVAHGLTLGADDYIYKPFDPRELLARAESKIKARRLEEKLQRRTKDLQALLRVGEELNQSLLVADLLDLVLFLALDLLPGSLAAVFQVSESYEPVAIRYQPENAPHFDFEAVLTRFLGSPQPAKWPGGTALAPEFAHGMAMPLQHGERLLGMLMLVRGDEAFDDYHMRLFEGIGRQAALALRNAELYEEQMHNAERLEEMVLARTAELQSAQQMLIRSEKLASIGHLAASIAHEINNPLQPIRIHLEDMVEDIQHKHPVDVVAIENIQQSIERITRIVTQLLEFAGKRNTDTDAQYVDLRRTLEGVINLNRKLFEQNGMTIKARLD
ncbi:MAG: response regulator, partial [Anaerolineae bacterium]|nr:response regulator [Anaerolineae bacterium]